MQQVHPASDLLALDDFAEGAMENWGLITFRALILLYDRQRSTEKAKENTALVVCHEVAHQVSPRPPAPAHVSGSAIT